MTAPGTATLMWPHMVYMDAGRIRARANVIVAGSTTGTMNLRSLWSYTSHGLVPIAPCCRVRLPTLATSVPGTVCAARARERTHASAIQAWWETRWRLSSRERRART
eukprot:Rmarinus@m.16173